MSQLGQATIADYERRAREAMPGGSFDYLFGTPDTVNGRNVWSTDRNNVAAFDAVKFRPRVLLDRSGVCNLGTTVLGQTVELPVMLAPTGNHQRAHPEGELATARVSKQLGIIMVLSNDSSYTIEEVAEVGGPRWFQLYLMRDRRLSENLVRRADEAGYEGLVVTIDNTGHRTHERDQRYFYQLKPNTSLRNYEGVDLPDLPNVENYRNLRNRDTSWQNIGWLQQITSMPLIVKGIQTVEDARTCADNGAAAIIISNHGGHALGDAAGTAEVLPEIADEVGDRLEVYIDGGVRRGSDVLKALAMGAKAVLIGRPIYWGLAVDGAEGLREVIEIMRDELETVMYLCGATDVTTVDRAVLSLPHRPEVLEAKFDAFVKEWRETMSGSSR
jgi:4-hydroxymandelate oxidase